MIKEIKKITNNSLDFKNLEENHLSIQLSLDGFSFCIYNKVYNVIAVFAHYEFEKTPSNPFEHLEFIKQIYLQEANLKLNYKTVNVTHFNNLVTQVPQPFFNKNNLSDYLQNTIKVLENDYITYDKLNNSEIINVYIPFVNINNFLIDIYGTFIFKHSSTVLIETLLNKYKNLDSDFCFVNVTNFNFEIVVLKDKKLALFNFVKPSIEKEIFKPAFSSIVITFVLIFSILGSINSLVFVIGLNTIPEPPTVKGSKYVVDNMVKSLILIPSSLYKVVLFIKLFSNPYL